MASKVPVQLKSYKVRKPKDEQTSTDKYETRLCIINVSKDLADYLELTTYKFPPSQGTPRPNPVNVTHYGESSTGTYHGKTCYIITDGEGGEVYKKMYRLQLPENYPIEFLKSFLEERQTATSSTIKYVKVRNGRRYPVRPVPVPP